MQNDERKRDNNKHIKCQMIVHIFEQIPTINYTVVNNKIVGGEKKAFEKC